MRHCVETIVRLVESGADDRRSVLQLGYNLGRLSELTGLGRGPFWDAWKDAASAWDRPRLAELARELPKRVGLLPPDELPNALRDEPSRSAPIPRDDAPDGP